MGRVFLGLFLGLSCFGVSEPAFSEEPLHARIDSLILAAAKGAPAAPLTDDAEFCRRVWLDLAGRIPSSSESRQFLSDSAPDKRAKLIDQLLASPHYPRRMQEVYHVLLMERLGDHAEWQKYLYASFSANKPWNQMVREMLNPNADDEATRGAALFLSKRLENYGQNPVDLPGMTRDVGRLFLGVDLQCAECHDHLFVDDYKQADFQGLHTFLMNTSLRSGLPYPALEQKPLKKKTEFMSVFKKEPKSTGPRLYGGSEVEIPQLAPGEEYAVAPNPQAKSPGQLKFNPLGILSEQLPRPENVQFARNSVNRLWFLLMGRGLVHPLDLHHAGNPPAYPEVLELLATEFSAKEYDLKWLIRELCMTQTYQRSGLLPEGSEPRPEQFLLALEKPLSPEQLLWSTLRATGQYERLELGAKDVGSPAAPIPEDIKNKFLKAFANPPREPEGEFAPSVKGALFVMHDSLVLGWLKPEPGSLVARVMALPDHAQMTEELYLSVLTRLPSEEEKSLLSSTLKETPGKEAEVLSRWVWALLASTEFNVNH